MFAFSKQSMHVSALPLIKESKIYQLSNTKVL